MLSTHFADVKEHSFRRTRLHCHSFNALKVLRGPEGGVGGGGEYPPRLRNEKKARLNGHAQYRPSVIAMAVRGR